MDAALQKNVIDQRDRLLEQLKDMEELREELEADEYDAMKADTIAQLKDFDASLAKMVAGNMTLQSELDSTRMAVRAAISEAFKTPEVIKMFAKKGAFECLKHFFLCQRNSSSLQSIISEPTALRRRLAEIDRDVKLGKMDFSTVSDQVCSRFYAAPTLSLNISSGPHTRYTDPDPPLCLLLWRTAAGGRDLGGAQEAR